MRKRRSRAQRHATSRSRAAPSAASTFPGASARDLHPGHMEPALDEAREAILESLANAPRMLG